MLNYLEKFKELPVEIRDKVSGKEAVAQIKALESEYGVSLAAIIMRVAVKEMPFSDLVKFFEFEKEMEPRLAEDLAKELKAKIFDSIGEHLGFEKEEPIISPLQPIAEEDSEESLLQWIEKRKKEIESRGPKSSNFFFSSDDEDELKQHSQKIENFKKDENLNKTKEFDFDEVINQLMKDLGINFSSEDLKRRFYGIIKTYLKGVRNKIDTKQAMTREVGSGGMGFADIYADNILILADKVKKQGESEGQKNAENSGEVENWEEKEKTLDISAQSARDHDYDFKNMPKIERKNEENLPDEKEAPRIDSGVEAKEPETIIISKEEPEKNPLKNIEKNNDAEIKIEAHPKTPPIRPISQSDKPKIEDVRHVPKLIGPIEELREMDLASFRRLDLDPGERTKKIIDKISFLEEDNYSQRLAGIRAWRRSEVNRIYLEIGRKSIGAKQGINDIIKGLRDKGEDCLTEEEFMAIMELNKQLRY